MASPGSDLIITLYKKWDAYQRSHPDMGVAEMRSMFDEWGGLTVEPAGVEYVEVNAGGVPALWIEPAGADRRKVLMCSHGGGYVGGSVQTHRKLWGHIAKAVGCRALAVDYALAPERPHPAPVFDMVKVYRWLLGAQGFAPGDVAFTGDSAGGALALTAIAAAREQGLPLPAASLPMSPWSGGDTSGASYDTNATNDVLTTREMTAAISALFLGPDGHQQDPLANPLRIDYTGYPPIYIQVGSYEAIVDDSRRVADSAKRAGVDVKLDVFPEMQHCFQLMAGNAPEADDAVARAGVWLKARLGLQ